MKALWRMSLVGAVGLAAVCGAVGGQARPAAAAVVVETNQEETDAMITAVIKAKLESNKLLHLAQVTIVTKNGFVTLVGMVPSDFGHTQALAAVRETPGVVGYDDQLRINYNSPQAPSHN